MSIVEFDRPPSWSPDMSKTGESTKYPWLESVGFIVLGWRGGKKNRETVTTSLYVMFASLFASATATTDWSKGQYSSSEHSRVLTTYVTESDIHNFAAPAKMALMSEYFFLENVLLLINCLLFILEGWCQSKSKKRLSFSFTQKKRI